MQMGVALMVSLPCSQPQPCCRVELGRACLSSPSLRALLSSGCCVTSLGRPPENTHPVHSGTKYRLANTLTGLHHVRTAPSLPPSLSVLLNPGQLTVQSSASLQAG